MIHTAYDVMKEFLITDADLDGKYGIPKIPKTFTDNYQRKKKLSKSQTKRTERLEKSSKRRYGTRKKEGLNKL